MEVHSSTVPLCWNYTIEEYPQQWRVSHAWLDEDMEDQEDHMYSQETVESADQEAMQTIWEDMSADISAGQLLQAFKDMLPMCNTKQKRENLMNTLTEFRLQLTRDLAAQTITTGSEFVSSNLPFDTDKLSTQHTYKRRKR